MTAKNSFWDTLYRLAVLWDSKIGVGRDIDRVLGKSWPDDPAAHYSDIHEGSAEASIEVDGAVVGVLVQRKELGR